MMRKRNDKYAIESAAEKFFVELAKLVRAFRRYCFEFIPKNKMDKYAHTVELISWIMLTFAIILRMK